MTAADNIENNRLGRESQSLEIDMNICKPGGFHLTNLNIRRLRTGAIQVAPQAVSSRSSCVPLDRITGEMTPPLGFRTLNVTVMYIGTNVTSDLDMDQGGSILDQLKFAAKQLDDGVIFYVSCVSGGI